MTDKTSLTADYANRTDLVTTSDLTTFVNNNSGIVSGTVQNTTSGTFVDFTGIPSWVKRITVMFSGVSTNGSSPLLVQIGSGAIQSTGYVGTSGAFNFSNATTGTTATTGFPLVTTVASNTNTGSMVIHSFATNTYVSSHSYMTNTGTVGCGGGNVTLSGTLDRIRITTVNGTDTFDAGQIGLLYE